MNFEADLNRTLGALIKEHRRDKGLTQAQLAKLVGLSTRHIGKLEDGTYSPKLSTYLKISGVLGFDIEDVRTVCARAQSEQEVKILFLLKKMDKKELELSYNFLKTLVSL